MKSNQPTVIYRKDYTPPCYLIDAVELTFKLSPKATRVTSKLQVRATPGTEGRPEPLVLEGQHLRLLAISMDGRSLQQDQDYKIEHHQLTLLSPSKKFELSLETEISPETNTRLQGLYMSNGLFCTQCEANGFRNITYYLDRPDVLAIFTTKIIADKDLYPVLLSNGNNIEKGNLKANQHYALWHDPFPKPAYLFALVAGKLEQQADTYVTTSGRKIDLHIFVEKENLMLCDHAMNSLKKAMAWDEKTYGLEYDLDIYMIVAVNDFNMGAMENKGLNIFNAKYVLADKETATDQDYLNIESVIAHEYFHNWTGNRVTLRDWFQLSLKEGLTVFRDQLFSADMGSSDVCRIDNVNVIRTAQFAEDDGPMAHPIRPNAYIEMNNFYTVTVYNKGAEVIRMLQTILGVKGFRLGLDLYFSRHDGQAVTTDDFIQAMSDANQVDLEQFRLWYSAAGTPEVSVEGHFNSEQKTFSLSLTQQGAQIEGERQKQPLHIPVSIGLFDQKGEIIPICLKGENKDSEVKTTTLQFKKMQQSYIFQNIMTKPIVSLFRGFSAPVKVKYPYNESELNILLNHDADGFNRWDAGRQLVLIQLEKLIKQYSMKQPLQVDVSFIETWRNLLSDKKTDKYLLARLLALPSEQYIAQTMKTIDVAAIVHVRDFLQQHMAQVLLVQWEEMYHNCSKLEAYNISAEQIAIRSLKQVCLNYLMVLCTENERILTYCIQQLHTSDNMTDSISALQAISHYANDEIRNEILAAFYEQWKEKPLVVNKWLEVQAVSQHKETLTHVKSLIKHPGFEWSNPNKVYALLVAFSQRNLRNFHIESGEGYRFIAECVLHLNHQNPQVAARLVNAFTQWRHYSAPYHQLMKQALMGMSRNEALSKDVYEVVMRSIGTDK